MAGVRKKPKAGGKYQGYYTDFNGKRKFFAGTRNRAETLRMAQKFEDQHRQVRLGYRPASTKADKAKSRPYCELKDEYIAWGETVGGRSSMPWGETHCRMKKSHLNWWEERLGLEVVGDLYDILPQVEAALRDLQAAGRSGKTLANYSESICSLCDWAEKRGYLMNDPLKHLSTWNTRPQSIFRAPTMAEVYLLLQVAPPERKLLYLVAAFTGLRAGELRSLIVGDLNVESQCLNLHAEWTKNRKQGTQPIPHFLVEILNKETEGKNHDDPILSVPSHPSRELDIDLDAADIPKSTPEGKIVFHSFRSVYINMIVGGGGGNLKEIQTLARHSTPDLTMNVYAKTTPEGLSRLIENMEENIDIQKIRALCVPHQVSGGTGKAKKALKSRKMDSNDEWWRRRESNPRPKTFAPGHYARSPRFVLALPARAGAVRSGESLLGYGPNAAKGVP